MNPGAREEHMNACYSLRMSRALWQRLSFAALALVMSFHFAMCYARGHCCAWSSIYVFAYGDPGIAYRPRLLMRYVYRLVYALTQDKPPAFAHGVMTPQEIAIFSISFVSMLVIVYLTRAAIGVELGKQSPARWFALLTVYMCCYQYILTPQNPVAFPYDTPAVAAFAIALYAMLSRKRWMFYAVIVVASFNRETTFFLPPMFLILKLDPSVSLVPALKRVRISLWAEVAFQMLICISIVHWCNVSTKAVLGPTYAVPQNIHFFLSPQHWPTLLAIFGFLWWPYALFFRRIRNINLQRIALLFPFWFIAMTWKADLLEVRVESEWVPYLTLCLALIARNSLLLREEVSAQHPEGIPKQGLLASQASRTLSASIHLKPLAAV
jgi:hypothetical protein